MVSTLDFESRDPSSNLGGTYFFLLKSEMKSAFVIIHKRWFSVKKCHQSPSAISATPTTAGTGFFCRNPKSDQK